MAYTQAVLTPDPLYLQPKAYDARSDRKWFSDIISPGVIGSGDYAVTATAGNMNISIAAGVAYILGQNVPDQGTYRQYTTAATVLTVGANASGNPRIDTVILRVMDNAADSSTFNEARVEIVPGAPTAGATLANLNGKANLATLTDSSKSVLALAFILVPNGATVLTTATSLKDARVRASVGSGGAFGGVPIGATLEWNSATIPGGGFYLTEDGSAISRTLYAAVFAILGTAFGAGDGSSTFNVPDSRGRTVAGFAPSGGHADMSAVGNTDGYAVAVRRIRHKHNITIADPTHAHQVQAMMNGGGTNTRFVGIGGLTGTFDGSLAFGPGGLGTQATATGLNSSNVLIGPQTGAEPIDAPAYIVKHKILRVA